MTVVMQRLTLVLFFVTVTFSASPTFAEIVTMSGSNGVLVYDDDGGAGDHINYSSPGVPINGVVSASQLMLRADLAFNSLIESELLTSSFESTLSVLQTVQQVRTELYSSAGGGFWFTTDLDVEVSVSGRMSYDLIGSESETGIFVEVFNGNHDRIDQRILGSITDEGSGALVFEDSFVLEGGSTYSVDVHNDLVVYARRFPDDVSTSFSEVTLQIATVPEPISLVLLCCGIPLVLKRRRRLIVR